MKNLKELWQDEEFLSQNLTMEDMTMLIEYITPWLQSMELKFSWDYSVNNISFSYFVDMAMREMYEIVNSDYKERCDLYPKQLDFESLWNIISECSVDVSINKENIIYEAVKEKILEISKKVLREER